MVAQQLLNSPRAKNICTREESKEAQEQSIYWGVGALGQTPFINRRGRELRKKRTVSLNTLGIGT